MGRVDSQGATSVPFQYPQLRQACDDGWAFCLAEPGKPNQSWGLVNAKGQVVAPASYLQIGKSPSFPVPVAALVAVSGGKPQMRWGEPMESFSNRRATASCSTATSRSVSRRRMGCGELPTATAN